MFRIKYLRLLILSPLLCTLIEPSAQSQDGAQLQAKIASLREEIQAKEKAFLAPSADDLAAFAEFLGKPDTGMARLMPREKYDGKLLIRGGGAYYSFARLTNEYGYGSDLQLEQGQLSVGFAGADFGFLASLGDVAIDSVGSDYPGVRYLADFKTPSTEPEAREQQRRAGSGFGADGFIYKNRLIASLNMTYAVRSIDYDVSDVLVVFKVTRQDADGSLILVWKILRRFPIPQLVR